ncbi:MAG: hypothetical protein QOF51_2264 [Chloroflexota bacterium]|jgi:peroxiredoxin family protein|nr:hypothetical protein [Chloroflexota bacterium]
MLNGADAREGGSTSVAAIVTRGDAATIASMTARCTHFAREGARVRVFFRDEAIPAICAPFAATRLGYESGENADNVEESVNDPGSWSGTRQPTAAMLHVLAQSGDVQLFACSSSLYVWGVDADDLLPSITGPRGLIAFLVEDLAGARHVLSY